MDGRVLTSALAAVAGLTALTAYAQQDLPEPEAEAVWSYLQQQNYEQWPFWPGKEGFYEGTRPHGAQLKTYVNETALDALKDFDGDMPAGSIIVKENYTPQKDLAAVTVMYQAGEGYNADHNNWFWLKRLPDGTVEAAGKVDSCQACHQSAPKAYLFTDIPGN
ncbi:cytochrome P460 family protein [Proteobacteria bacterium 005FR1]|nr:cytochrome P460 family protein [Proteobacteria bacterium 005FR1]